MHLVRSRPSRRRLRPKHRRRARVCRWCPPAVREEVSVRPRLLDLFCGAGGAAMGYHRAGFEVVGVDVKAQPRFPFQFVRADALEYLAAHGGEFDAVAASPPCFDWSTLAAMTGGDGSGWLLDATRTALDALGRPYVMENVPGAPMRYGLRLCGSEFGLSTIDHDGQRVQLRRHRYFESNVFLMGAGGCQHDPTARVADVAIAIREPISRRDRISAALGFNESINSTSSPSRTPRWTWAPQASASSARCSRACWRKSKVAR